MPLLLALLRARLGASSAGPLAMCVNALQSVCMLHAHPLAGRAGTRFVRYSCALDGKVTLLQEAAIEVVASREREADSSKLLSSRREALADSHEQLVQAQQVQLWLQCTRCLPRAGLSLAAVLSSHGSNQPWRA